ncbi:MAG: phosphoribosylformylglycinamidine synthase subunit PurS [Phycisphaerales bacterium]
MAGPHQPHASHPSQAASFPVVVPPSGARVVRVEVRTRAGLLDPRAASATSRARALGFPVTRAESARVYVMEGALSGDAVRRIASGLLCDPVTETAAIHWNIQDASHTPAGAVSVEVHPQPGVMDPAAQSVRDAIFDLVGVRTDVATCGRFDLHGVTAEQARAFAGAALANPVIQDITVGAWFPAELPKGHEYALVKRTVTLRGLTEEQLARLSREAHLFLSLTEMKAVQAEYDRQGRDPSDIELETIAQTWSEHCVHKTLKAKVRYTGAGVPSGWQARPGHSVQPDGSVSIDNLLKRTVAAATHELIAEGVDWTLSVFKDNSGVIALDDEWGVNIKVETHNRPSAIEPYGGAATGIGGCIRDVIATGLGAKPIASTDVFCVADHRNFGGQNTLPPGTLPPRRVLQEVVAGVRDYGNRMGIPTVSGGVHFDDRYVGNPLVFCGCIGLIPRTLVHGKPGAGDRIIALGGRTGRDGIHGATFSSAELQHTASTEFAHAVQIGNAIEEKRLLDAVLRARDGGTSPLYSALTDCGAGGFSSAIGEMASTLGAVVHLDKAPLKYAGLSYTEVWISEAQERVVLAVPAQNVPALQRICDEEGVELADLGHFGTDRGEIVLRWRDGEVGRLSCGFLHEGIPMPTREAAWDAGDGETERRSDGVKAADRAATSVSSSSTPSLPLSISSSLLTLLAHPTIASKHWIIRQYDHEVQGNTVIKPLLGPRCMGPSDASVVEPMPGAGRGFAVSQGLQTALGDPRLGGDPYQMALAAIDECVRNLVCVGADPSRTAILDNFCWPSCDNPRNMGALVRACEGCYDGAKAYRTPFVSGKDSLSNQLRYVDPGTGEQKLIEVPYTLLITGLGIVPDIRKCVTMDAKKPGNIVLLVGETQPTLGASLYQSLHGADGPLPTVSLASGPATARAVAALIARGLVRSAHDCSEGGALTALAEMLIAGHDPRAPMGATVHPDAGASDILAFAESPSRYLLEVSPSDELAVTAALREPCIPVVRLATLNSSGSLTWKAESLNESVDALTEAWRGTLDW